MLALYVMLAMAGLAAAIGGGVWLAVRSGGIRRRTGRDVGAEVMAGESAAEDDGTAEAAGTSKRWFRGTGVKLEASGETTYSAMKASLRQRRWGEALPPLIAFVGMLFAVLFGALALQVGIEDRLVGWIAVCVALYVDIRQVYDLIRA